MNQEKNKQVGLKVKPGEPLNMKTRLKAWWEGYDLSALKRDAVETADAQPEHSESDEPAFSPSGTPRLSLNRRGLPLWSATRIQVTEKLWGEDFISPGGRQFVFDMIKPLNLSDEMNVLNLAAGLGGAARVMAEECGTWVTGLECAPVLIEEARKRSNNANVANTVSIKPYDPENFTLFRRYDVVFAQEAFFCLKDKERTFNLVEAAMKPGGQLLFTDFVLTEDSALDKLDFWLQAEPIEPAPLTCDACKTMLEEREMDVRICQDLTTELMPVILKSLTRLRDHLNEHRLDAETRTAITEEVDLWAARATALQQGLRIYRFHALKPAEEPESLF